MKIFSTHREQLPSLRPPAEQARARINLLVLAVFLLGLAAGAFWFQRTPGTAGTGSQQGIILSEATRSVLGNLKSPVEIRFYSLLKDSSISASQGAFAERAGNLVAQYEQVAGGNVRVVRLSSPTDSEMDAALADGIAPFNREKGDVCYLGIALAQAGQRESIPQLLPEWETALESDLTRAIERVSKPRPAQPRPAGSVEVTTTATEDLKRYIPNLDAVSVEEGTARLFEAARVEITEATKDYTVRVQGAEDQYADAVSSGKSEAEQQAAREQLQKMKTQQAEKFKQISAEFRARIAAFEQLKSGTR